MHLLDCAPTAEIQEHLLVCGAGLHRDDRITRPLLDGAAVARVAQLRPELHQAQLMSLCCDPDTLADTVAHLTRTGVAYTTHTDRVLTTIAANPAATEATVWAILDYVVTHGDSNAAANQRCVTFEQPGADTEFIRRLRGGAGIGEDTAITVLATVDAERAVELAVADHTQWYRGVLLARHDIGEHRDLLAAAIRTTPSVLRHTLEHVGALRDVFLANLTDTAFAEIVAEILTADYTDPAAGGELGGIVTIIADLVADGGDDGFLENPELLCALVVTAERHAAHGRAWFVFDDWMHHRLGEVDSDLLSLWPATMANTAALLGRRQVTDTVVWAYLCAQGTDPALRAGEYADLLCAMSDTHEPRRHQPA